MTLVAWCNSCWKIRCVSSFNYFNMSQFTHTNTTTNSYLRNDSCCCREYYNLHLKINWHTKKQYTHAKHQDWCFKIGMGPFFKQQGKLHHLNLAMTIGMVEQVWMNVSQCRGMLIPQKFWQFSSEFRCHRMWSPNRQLQCKSVKIYQAQTSQYVGLSKISAKQVHHRFYCWCWHLVRIQFST